MNDAPRNVPPSETYRLVAKEWVEKDGTARMLEECKTAVLAQKMRALGDMPAAHAEREVKASQEWDEYIHKMVDARTAANLAKVKTEYYRMKFSEWMSEDANKRAEMKL
jgi:hypothetical protein